MYKLTKAQEEKLAELEAKKKKAERAKADFEKDVLENSGAVLELLYTKKRDEVIAFLDDKINEESANSVGTNSADSVGTNSADSEAEDEAAEDAESSGKDDDSVYDLDAGMDGYIKF